MADFSTDVLPAPHAGVRQSFRPHSALFLGGLVVCADMVALVSTGALALFANVTDGLITVAPRPHIAIALVGALLCIAILKAGRQYRLDALTRADHQIVGATIAWIIMWAGLLLIGNNLDILWLYSREWAAAWAGLGLVGLLCVRLCIRNALNQAAASGRLDQTVVLIGTGPTARALLRRLHTDRASRRRVVALFQAAEEPAANDVDGCPVIGGLATLPAFARAHAIDEVIIGLPWSAEEAIREALRVARMLPVDVHLLPDVREQPLSVLDVCSVGDVCAYALAHPPLKDWKAVVKRVEDIVVCSLVLVLIAPLLLACAVAIRLDSPGPILFRQRRYGYNNTVFNVLKFRTMYVDACDVGGTRQTIRGDARVTRVGQFLRRMSFDELPQIFNVLRGDMSIIGPRPHPVGMQVEGRPYHELVPDYWARHRVLPGITGWAQVNGLRGEVDSFSKAQRRVEHDVYYVENWSIWLDFQILARTARQILSDPNAY